MKLFKTITLTMVLMGLTACGSSRASNPNSKYITERHLAQNHWISQLYDLLRQNKLSQDYNPNPPTLNEVVQANIDIVAGKATVIDELPILGVLDLSVPKVGEQSVVTFSNRGMGVDDSNISKRSQTDIYTDPKNGDIREINVSRGLAYFNIQDIDVKKLNLVFEKYEVEENRQDDYRINKIFSLKNNPKLKVIFTRLYQGLSCDCVNEKDQYDYDKTHLKQMQKFDDIKISKQ